jgi:hypothetical protein
MTWTLDDVITGPVDRVSHLSLANSKIRERSVPVARSG